jgi:hypothetical protein
MRSPEGEQRVRRVRGERSETRPKKMDRREYTLKQKKMDAGGKRIDTRWKLRV